MYANSSNGLRPQATLKLVATLLPDDELSTLVTRFYLSGVPIIRLRSYGVVIGTFLLIIPRRP
jgi:hypothetical protein